MSHYATSRFMWEVTRDKDLAERFRADPDGVLVEHDLSDDERRALATSDIRALFEQGIHPFVLYHFALRLAGGFSMPFVENYVRQLDGLILGDLET